LTPIKGPQAGWPQTFGTCRVTDSASCGAPPARFDIDTAPGYYLDTAGGNCRMFDQRLR
jgi:hypothetical protein